MSCLHRMRHCIFRFTSRRLCIGLHMSSCAAVVTLAASKPGSYANLEVLCCRCPSVQEIPPDKQCRCIVWLLVPAHTGWKLISRLSRP